MPTPWCLNLLRNNRNWQSRLYKFQILSCLSIYIYIYIWKENNVAHNDELLSWLAVVLVQQLLTQTTRRIVYQTTSASLSELAIWKRWIQVTCNSIFIIKKILKILNLRDQYLFFFSSWDGRPIFLTCYWKGICYVFQHALIKGYVKSLVELWTLRFYQIFKTHWL